MGFRIEDGNAPAALMRAATASDHQVIARQQTAKDRKVFYVVNIPAPSAPNAPELPCPYFLPTFETREAALLWRHESSLESYSITELVLERSR